MKYFPPKDPTETRLLSFEFDLPAGVSLSGSPTFVLTQLSGTPDPNTGTMPVGSAQTVGNVIEQMVTAGINGNTYSATVRSPTSAGEVIAIGAVLPVQAAWLQ